MEVAPCVAVLVNVEVAVIVQDDLAHPHEPVSQRAYDG
jgi:hypothetical protein